MEGCGTKYQMSRSPEHKNSLGSTDYALIKWEIGPYLITFEKKHPVHSKYFLIHLELGLDVLIGRELRGGGGGMLSWYETRSSSGK